MPSMTIDDIVRQAAELAASGDAVAAADALIASVGADRQALGAARDQVARHLHHQIDDFEATAALTVLNRALSRVPIVDPMDWRVRWAKHRKP
jgi:hypothetical protein